MPRLLIYILSALIPMSCWATEDYVGDYRIRGVEIRYTIPSKLMGAPFFTRIDREFRDERHMGIFATSFSSSPDGKPHPGLILGLAPSPRDVIWGDDINPYAKYYYQKLAKMGTVAKTDAVVIGGRKWLRVQQYFPNGNLARVLYVAKLFDDLNLVCRIGMLDNEDPEHIEADAAQWSNQAESVVRSIVMIRTGNGR